MGHILFGNKNNRALGSTSTHDQYYPAEGTLRQYMVWKLVSIQGTMVKLTATVSAVKHELEQWAICLDDVDIYKIPLLWNTMDVYSLIARCATHPPLKTCQSTLNFLSRQQMV